MTISVLEEKQTNQQTNFFQESDNISQNLSLYLTQQMKLFAKIAFLNWRCLLSFLTEKECVKSGRPEHITRDSAKLGT